MVKSLLKRTGTSQIRPTLWVHASEQEDAAALKYLCHRLMQMDMGAEVVMTTPASQTFEKLESKGLKHIKISQDTSSFSQEFLNSFYPPVLIWAGGNLKPNLLSAAASLGMKMVLVNAKSSDFKPRGIRILPDTTRKTLRLFSEFYAINETAANQLNRMGISPYLIKVKGPLQRAGAIPITSEEFSEKLMTAFAGRTLWLAAYVSEAEANITLSAHRMVMRHDHRSLLLVVPQNQEDHQKIREKAEKAGLRVSSGKSGDIPSLMTQVFVSPSPEDLFACYALAPVAFLGQTLHSNRPALDPYTPATFGCALLYGSKVAPYLERYNLLAKQGAAQIVSDAISLAKAVSHVISPETSAKMAFSAWEVISEGSNLTDAILEDLLDHFERLDRQI